MRLPTYSGTLENLSPDGRAADPARARGAADTHGLCRRACHLGPAGRTGPPWDTRPAVDWDATLAFRQGLWDQGLGLAEAMDTAQRGMGVDWGHGAGADPADHAGRARASR